MQNLKSKFHYIVLSILLLSGLFEFHLPYIFFSVCLIIVLSFQLVSFCIIEHLLRQNVLSGLKHCEKLLEKQSLSVYKGFNVVIYISIAIMLYWQGFILTSGLYAISHLFMYYILLRASKAKLFRSRTTGLVFNVSDIVCSPIEGEQTVVYVLVGNTIKSSSIRDLVFGLSDGRTLRASDYGVCLTRNDAEDLLDLLKSKGWLK